MKRAHDLTRALALCLLLAAPAEAATWTATPPTTGAPCVEWRWRGYDPSGYVFHDALTAGNFATIPEPFAPQKVECQCFDALGRPSPWSVASLPFYPPRLVSTWWGAGVRLKVSGLSMVSAMVQSTEWVETQ